MSKAAQLALIIVILAPLADASGSCPVTLITGTRALDSISITFRNASKLPIRRLEFNCKVVDAKADKTQPIHCHEKNALFFPGTEYTVNYASPSGVRGPVRVSLKSVTFADGPAWKPSKRDSCRVLKIYPAKIKK
ncbi:MAG: hypothetical protein DMG74_14375 [Acidobacteria bacterium]|nr:MAG: hypothetical protein DMG74_14375 [Acidobacteriota bacterium]